MWDLWWAKWHWDRSFILQVFQFFPVSIILHYFLINHSSIDLPSYQFPLSLKKLVCVLGRSFHIHISVHNWNKPVNAIKNINLCTYSHAKEDDTNQTRNSKKHDLMALQRSKMSGVLLTLLHWNSMSRVPWKIPKLKWPIHSFAW
jgi:hypothetical protein